MTYSNLDEMYEDLGLVMRRKRIVYRLAGELQDSEIITRGVVPGSQYAQQMKDTVTAYGLLFDRADFHGQGVVLIDYVEDV